MAEERLSYLLSDGAKRKKKPDGAGGSVCERFAEPGYYASSVPAGGGVETAGPGDGAEPGKLSPACEAKESTIAKPALDVATRMRDRFTDAGVKGFAPGSFAGAHQPRRRAATALSGGSSLYRDPPP